MKMSSIRRTLLSTAAVALLAGCVSGPSAFGPSQSDAPSGRESGLTPLSLLRIAALTVDHPVAIPQHPDHRKSWISPDAAKSELLYVSDWATNDVFIYNYLTGALVGTLTGFERPYGQCVDKQGDVWITEFQGGAVDEYPHGSTTRINSLSTDGYAIGCAVAPNGDLAVSNFETAPSGTGNVQVFKQATWPPTTYSNEMCNVLWAPGYLPNGHLYAASQAPNGSSLLCELTSTDSSLNPSFPPFDEALGLPGGVQWDGKYITITDQDYGLLDGTTIYQAQESASGGLVEVSSTVLKDTCDHHKVDVVQPFIVGKVNTPENATQGTAVVGGNSFCSSRVNVWRYAAGGHPKSSLDAAPQQPYGMSVSITKQSN